MKMATLSLAILVVATILTMFVGCVPTNPGCPAAFICGSGADFHNDGYAGDGYAYDGDSTGSDATPGNDTIGQDTLAKCKYEGIVDGTWTSIWTDTKTIEVKTEHGLSGKCYVIFVDHTVAPEDGVTLTNDNQHMHVCGLDDDPTYCSDFTRIK